jgi:hypothetical protein
VTPVTARLRSAIGAYHARAVVDQWPVMLGRVMSAGEMLGYYGSASGRYTVECDVCRAEIRRTDSVHESACGGLCDACRPVDVHVNGQTRTALEGEQTSLLPLPDSGIPASDGPELASEAIR